MNQETNSPPQKSQNKPSQENQQETLLDTDPDDGSILEGIRVPPIDAAGSDEDAPVSVQEKVDPDKKQVKVKVDLIGEEAFYSLFRMAFDFPAKVIKLPALAIQPDEEVYAHPASDAAYRIIKIYAPSMLTKETQTFKDFASLGFFLYIKASVVSEWLAARKELAAVKNNPAQFKRSGSQNKRPDQNGSEIDPAAFGTGDADNWEIEVRQ